MKKMLLVLLALGLTQAPLCQKTTTQKLDDFMQAYHKVNKFNGTVLIARKDTVLLEKGYGFKDAKGIFKIYSVTKTFTAAIILQLVEQKKLSLTDKLSTFYPGFPKSDSISIEHLLTHTSGLYDYTRGNDMKDGSEKSFIQFMQTKPLDFSPGKGWNYCNSGYWFLGFIIQKITGMPYEDAIRTYIFQPLHMKQSGFDFAGLRNKNKATGYEYLSSTLNKKAVTYNKAGPFAAGDIHSTVADLYNYYQGLQQHSILQPMSLEKAWSPFKNNYGYGWIIGSFEGKKVVSHSGGASGFRSNFAMLPDDDICIILLNNHEHANVEQITNGLLHILYEQPYKIPTEIPLSTEVLSNYKGAYNVKPGFTMYVNIQDGRLTAQISKQPKTTLLAEKENYFYAVEANAYVEFVKDSTKNVFNLIIHQGGQQLRGDKIFPTWGVTGTATTKGWRDDVPDLILTEDVEHKGLWVLKDIALQNGLLLFRLNNDWGYHYGDNGTDKTLEMFGADIKVEAGTYDIVLDLRNEYIARYKLLKKK